MKEIVKGYYKGRDFYVYLNDRHEPVINASVHQSEMEENGDIQIELIHKVRSKYGSTWTVFGNIRAIEGDWIGVCLDIYCERINGLTKLWLKSECENFIDYLEDA